MKTIFKTKRDILATIYDQHIELPINYLIQIDGQLFKVVSSSGEIELTSYVDSESGRPYKEYIFIHKIHLEVYTG